MSPTYEERRQEHLAAWGAALPDRLGRRTWDRAQIDGHRDAALRDLLFQAREGSAWHRERLAGVDLDRCTAADLTGLPTMTKADLLGSYDDIVTDRRVRLADLEAHLASLTDDDYVLGDLHAVASGGSSGQRAVFAYGWDAWVDVHLGLSRHVVADVFANPPAGPPDPLRMGVVAASNATHMTTAVSATFASPTVETHSFPVSLPLAEIVEGLNRLQPPFLTAYASMLGVLVEEAACGRLRIAPSRIVATSEPLLPEVRKAAEAVLGAPVANCWGTSEGGVMAVGCWQDHGMHVNEDLVILEPVDAAGRPVPPGERADKVLLTNLFNPLLPLIRYELTDEVTVLTEPCSCGSAYVRVADVEGRTDDVLRYGSISVHPHVVRSALGRHPGIADYQVRQRPDGLTVDVLGRGDPREVEAALAKELRALGIVDPVVQVRVVEALERHPHTGKLCRFVPLRPGAGSSGT